ncbi:RHS repeat domain-containing protein [Paenibacillus amylolyticus]|uniref:RHS repeat domain-containing protein n=1 Tax=Paenibacillus amylolyticus TaxID=1451 RepID=UPI0039B0E663
MTSVGTAKDAPDAQYKYYGNGLFKSSESLNDVSTLRTYNGLDLVSLEQVRGQDTLALYNYSYDSNKNITKRVQQGVQDDFTYDQLDRIATASGNNEQYTYDKQGNRLTMQSDKEVNSVESEYQYDTSNRLTQVITDVAKVNYQYNGDNLLVERTENGVATRYYYDDRAQIIAEAEVLNGTPELKANYIRGAKLEAIVYANGSKAYVQSNGHGDITELRDVDGALLNKYQYDVWGNLELKEEKVHNPFLYSGELWDDTTRLQYLRTRWYDPNTGRFINEDTFEGELDDPLSLNLYAYVHNNPLRYVDPSGRAKFGSTAYGQYAHKALGNIFKLINLFTKNDVAFTEKTVKLANGNSGRVDFALKVGESQYEIYELKPISWNNNPQLNKSGRDQLKSYIHGIILNGFRGDSTATARAGTTWNPNNVVIPSPFNSRKEIVFYTYYATQPGMIY